jgi:hypothetical protein
MDQPDYAVYCNDWEVGRIYQTRGGPDSLRWFWSMNANGPMTRSEAVSEQLGRLEGVGEAGRERRVADRQRRRILVG